jgi:hypothetical protein
LGNSFFPSFFLGGPQDRIAFDDVSDGRIRGEGNDEIVEFFSSLSEWHAGFQKFRRRVDRCCECRNDDLGPVWPFGAFRRTQREYLQCGREVFERNSSGLQRQAEMICGGEFVGSVHIGSADASAANRDQAFGLKDPESFPDRGVADSEVVYQFLLNR